MRLLVTGATGFIGSHLIPALVDQGHSVIATDIGAEPELIMSNGDVEYMRANLERDGEIYKVMSLSRPDKVVHLAGLLAGPCENDPALGFRVNVMATLALLDASANFGVKRFVMASTPAVFGRGLPEPVADDAIKLPETIYGQTKLACEHVLDWYRRIRGLSVGAVRFPWVYGPGRTTGITAEYSSFLLDAIARCEDLVVENADEVGDWLYVGDAVKALMLMLEHDDQPAIAYNIMSGVHSVRDAMAVAQKIFPEAKIKFREKACEPYPYASSYDDSNARKDIGWRPEYPIERGFQEHVETVRRSMEAV